MSTSGQDVEKAQDTMLSIPRPISFLTWPLSLWRRRNGGYKTEASSITHWDWRQKLVSPLVWLFQILMSPLVWLRSLFGWRKNENKNSINSRENEDMTGILESGIPLKMKVTDVDKLNEELWQLRERCEELQGQINNHGKEVTTLKWDCSQLRKENEDLRRQLNEKEQKEVILKLECNQMRTRNEDQRRQLYENEQQIDTLKKDCSQLRTRLSQIAAMQMTEGNPNIADLSDQNRPDKLAEQFSELYDNQWTDCFQILVDVRKKTEEESIDILLKIVQTSYDICLDRSQNILTTTKDSLFAFAGRSDEEPDKSLDTLIQEILHKLKSYRTKSFKSAPTNIRKEIEASLTSTIGEPEVVSCSCFIEECIRTCWLMCIKDPPMYIFCNKEVIFDKNKYMEYTEMGQEVSYVVWPALYLHKDGPLMRKGVAQGSGRNDRKWNKNVKAESHELPDENHIQEYHTHIEDTTKQDHAKEASQTKEYNSKDIANADGTLLISKMELVSNGDECNGEILGKHTKTDPTVEAKQYVDYVDIGQFKGTETTPIIENQNDVNSSESSKTERRRNDNICEPSEEAAEYRAEKETFDRDEIEVKKENIVTKHHLETNEACPQNYTNVEQMEKYNVISNIRTDEKDDPLEDDHSKAEMRDSGVPIVTEELPCEDTQASRTLLSRVAEVDSDVVSSVMKQNAEIQLQNTALIINHAVTKQPTLDPMVNDSNREDESEDCMKENKKMLNVWESQQSKVEGNAEVKNHNGSVRSDNGQKSEGECSCLHEDRGKNVCDCTTDDALVEELNKNDLHSLLDHNSSKEDKNNDETSTKVEVTEIKQADPILTQSDEYCQQKKISRGNGINEDKNQGDEDNDGSIEWNDALVGLVASNNFNGTSEKNICDSLNKYEQGDKLQLNNVFSSSDDILTQNREEEDCQASPNNEPIKSKDEADNTLSSSNECCQHGKSSDGSSVNEENHQRVEKHNGSMACDSGHISSSVPSAKNTCDSPSDDEQKEKLKLTTSSDDSRNEEAKGDDFQFPTKEEATEGKEETENKIVSYCKQTETSRACKGTKEENQGEEKQHGLEVFSNGKEKINVVHALSEKNTYDPPQDADQEEKL